MKTSAVFIVLLACTFAAEDIFAELKDSDFGKTLVATIEVELKSQTKDNVEHVVNMLKDVRKGFREQQQVLSDSYGVVADSCRSDMTEMDRKEDKLEATYTKNERLDMIDGPVFEDRTKEKANREQELAHREQTLANLDAENERQNAKFQDVLAQHNAVRAMMREARAIMQEAFQGDSEFLQVKTTALSKLSSHIRSFSPEENTIAHGYAQIFNVIALIAERSEEVADQGMFDTLMRIFDDIEDNLATSLSIEREAERQRQEAYGELKQRMNNEIAGLNKRIGDLGAELLTLRLAISQYADAMELSQGQLDDLAALRADKQASCGAEDAAYQYANNELMYQITTVGNAIYLLEDKRELLERFRDQ